MLRMPIWAPEACLPGRQGIPEMPSWSVKTCLEYDFLACLESMPGPGTPRQFQAFT